MSKKVEVKSSNHSRSIADYIKSVDPKFAKDAKTLLKLFKDNSGKMWLGTNGGGINTFNSLQLKISHGLFNYEDAGQAVYAFAETSDGTVWFTTDNGQLNKIALNGKISQAVIKNNKPISHLLVDDKDNFWLKTEQSKPSEPGSLYYYQTNTGNLIEHDAWRATSTHNDFSNLILAEGKLWFIDEAKQFSSFDLDSNKLEQINDENQTIYTVC